MMDTPEQGSFKTEVVDQHKSSFYLLDSGSDTSETRSKAEEAEATLSEAIHLTEKRTGSLLVFQQTDIEEIVALGRQISSLSRSHSLDDDCGTVNSVDSMHSAPVFVTAERCDPSFLRQVSLNAIMDSPAKDAASKTRTSLPRCEGKQRATERKWDKLRTSVGESSEKQNESSKSTKRKMLGLRSSLPFFRKKQWGDQPRKLDEGKRLVARIPTRNQSTKSTVSHTSWYDPAGESLEVVACSSSEGNFYVLPPFPTKMI